MDYLLAHVECQQERSGIRESGFFFPGATTRASRRGSLASQPGTFGQHVISRATPFVHVRPASPGRMSPLTPPRRPRGPPRPESPPDLSPRELRLSPAPEQRPLSLAHQRKAAVLAVKGLRFAPMNAQKTRDFDRSGRPRRNPMSSYEEKGANAK